MHSPFNSALEQVRKGNAPHRQASGVCLSEQPLSAYPILAGINSHNLLVRSEVPIPKAPSDVKGMVVSLLVCPWEWDRVLERRTSKATDNPRTKRKKATQMVNQESSVGQGAGKFVCLSLLTKTKKPTRAQPSWALGNQSCFSEMFQSQLWDSSWESPITAHIFKPGHAQGLCKRTLAVPPGLNGSSGHQALNQ